MGKKIFYLSNLNEVSDSVMDDNRTYIVQKRNSNKALIYRNGSYKAEVIDIVYDREQQVFKSSSTNEVFNDSNAVFLYSLRAVPKNNKDNEVYNAYYKTIPYLVSVERDGYFVRVQVDIKDVICLGRKRYYEGREMFGFTFNCKSGHTYYLQRVKLKNNTPIKVVGHAPARISGKHGFEDFDFGCIPNEVIKYIEDSILDIKEEILGFRPHVYREPFKSLLPYLVSINANPLCNPMFLLKNIFAQSYYRKVKSNDNQLGVLFEILNIKPSKTLRKMFFKFGPEALIDYKLFKESGYFKENDNLFKLVEAARVYDTFISYASAFTHSYQHGPLLRVSNGTLYVSTYDFFEKSTKKTKKEITLTSCFSSSIRNISFEELMNSFKDIYNDETIITRKLSKPVYEIRDTLYFYKEIKEMLDSNKINYRLKAIPFNNKRELKSYLRKALTSELGKKTHDDICSVYDVLTSTNKKIQYNAAERKLEESKEDVSILLAKDTLELKNIGREMNICVGGYGERAVNKYCTILHILKGGINRVCIELRGNHVIQIKGICNSYIDTSNDLYNTISQWIKKHHLDTSNCYDFQVA